METEIFEELGLSSSEIKTYLALLELGSSTAGPILEKSGLQNSVVHRALNSLIEKAIISYVFEGRRKIYQATDPENFNNFIDDKKRRFNEILPELKKKQIHKTSGTATIFKGIRGIKETYSVMINQKADEYLTFGGGEECAKRMGMVWWLNMHSRRVENKLASRQVFDESVREQSKEIVKMPLTKVRFIAKEFASFQETVIVGDCVAINVFTENPYSFLIKDEKVAQGYKKYFELLWRIGK